MTTNTSGQSINTGIKVGLNFATVGQYADGANPQSITTFNAGVFAKFTLLDLLALQPELLYTMKGFKDNYLPEGVPTGSTFPPENIIITWNISYFEIPVLLKLNIPSSSFGIIKPNIFAGPEISFKLSAKQKSKTVGQPSYEQDLTNINSTDLGIIFGVGADINLPIATIMIDVRYDLGMRSVDRTLESAQNPSTMKNRVISVNAGIGI
jgi:hypothetical protein